MDHNYDNIDLDFVKFIINNFNKINTYKISIII